MKINFNKIEYNKKIYKEIFKYIFQKKSYACGCGSDEWEVHHSNNNCKELILVVCSDCKKGKLIWDM